ncbi:hypothetical protein FACS1894208_00370 [Clostridia bacterium]|nr:hypothetical protein FACS1894208_00370 [Clostridia bacterium]
MQIDVMEHESELLATIQVDFAANRVSVTNLSDKLFFIPFGVNTSPTMQDLYNYLEWRCFPRARANCKQLLSDMNLSAYDPLAICRVTHGRQHEDYVWLRFDGEQVDYEKDIKLRD